MMASFEERFWQHVSKKSASQCWPWTAWKNVQGYGAIRVSRPRKMLLAHRAAWLINHGKIPKDMYVLHKCDNPSCCNPSHLFLGTKADNSQDMIKKGRSGRASLSYRDAEKIRAAHAKAKHGRKEVPKGFNLSLSRQYGVSAATIDSIARGKTWRAT